MRRPEVAYEAACAGSLPAIQKGIFSVYRLFDLGDEIEIRISDNGTGIAPEIRDKLFQPFVTTKPTGEGTGLGLSISYEIVSQQHGGSIVVDSELGAYTEFTVRLPRRNGRGVEDRR